VGTSLYNPACETNSLINIAIVTGIYPPVVGGEGAVMHSLATHAPDQISVVTCKCDQDGRRLAWEMHDSAQPETIVRLNRFADSLAWIPPGKIRTVAKVLNDRLILHPSAGHELIRILERLQPDLVIVNTSFCYWAGEVIKRWKPQLKVTFYVHGEEVLDARSDRGRKAVEALKGGDRVVAVSSFTKNALVNAGLDPDKVIVINNGVDTARFQPGPRSQAIIDRFRLSSRRILLTLARLDERKGQDMMIRAIPKIVEAVPDLAYLVVGEGSMMERLWALVSDLRLESTVLFTGGVSDEDVLQYYRTCDVYAMPNRATGAGETEGFGLVFLEAGACGKAVIGGKAGGVPDAIRDGKTGFLVDGTSVDAIAEACIKLLEDRELRDRFGANGLEHARQNDWTGKTQEFLALCAGDCGK
jgi:phosphatidylinositol alpha-1,6-mannosyltransferase